MKESYMFLMNIHRDNRSEYARKDIRKIIISSFMIFLLLILIGFTISYFEILQSCIIGILIIFFIMIIYYEATKKTIKQEDPKAPIIINSPLISNINAKLDKISLPTKISPLITRENWSIIKQYNCLKNISTEKLQEIVNNNLTADEIYNIEEQNITKNDLKKYHHYKNDFHNMQQIPLDIVDKYPYYKKFAHIPVLAEYNQQFMQLTDKNKVIELCKYIVRPLSEIDTIKFPIIKVEEVYKCKHPYNLKEKFFHLIYDIFKHKNEESVLLFSIFLLGEYECMNIVNQKNAMTYFIEKYPELKGRNLAYILEKLG